MTAQPELAVELFRTATGQRLHIPGCPHFGSPLVAATAHDLAGLEICTWCRAELDGVGRTYCPDLDEAMRVLGCWEGTQRLIRDALRFVTHDEFWLPHSDSYIALGREGRCVARVGKGYVSVVATGAYVELPGHRAGKGGGAPGSSGSGRSAPPTTSRRPSGASATPAPEQFPHRRNLRKS